MLMIKCYKHTFIKLKEVESLVNMMSKIDIWYDIISRFPTQNNQHRLDGFRFDQMLSYLKSPTSENYFKTMFSHCTEKMGCFSVAVYWWLLCCLAVWKWVLSHFVNTGAAILSSANTENGLMVMCGALEKSIHLLAYIMFMLALRRHRITTHPTSSYGSEITVGEKQRGGGVFCEKDNCIF